MAIINGIAGGTCIANDYQISQGSLPAIVVTVTEDRIELNSLKTKKNAKSCDFLRFLLYLCHVIDEFQLLSIAALM